MNNIATELQRRKFFALVHDLGINTTEAKERAKKKFNLKSFTEITSSQINELISAMEKKIAQVPHKHRWKCESCNAHLELLIIPMNGEGGEINE